MTEHHHDLSALLVPGLNAPFGARCFMTKEMARTPEITQDHMS